MTTLLDEDRLARQRALDPHGSFAVRAPAGSGKTSLLTQRLLRLLVTVEQPEQVVAITFTRKAAEEMRSRVIEALAQTDAPPPSDAYERQRYELACAVKAHDQERGWGLGTQPTRLRIMTIDALCQSLVRRMPVSAGVFGATAIEEDPVPLYQRAAREALTEIAGSGAFQAAAAAVFGHLDNNWQRLEGLLAQMLAVRDQWLRWTAGGADRASLERAFEHAITERIEALTAQLSSDELGTMGMLGGWAGAHREASPLAELDGPPAANATAVGSWRELAALFVTKGGERRRRVTKKDGFPTAKGEAATMKQCWAETAATLDARPQLVRDLYAVSQLPEPRFGDEEWASVEALATLLHAAVAHLMVLSDQRGATDFTALSMAAGLALGKDDAPTDLALSLDYQIRHLLIDEFQDTSVTQFELVRRLTAGWTPGDGRSIFIVGDPMQSIYRFRQADVSRFHQVMRDGRIGDVPVETLRLRANFRSQAALVNWVNAAIPPALETAAAPTEWFEEQHAVLEPAAEAVQVHAMAGRDDALEARRLCDIVSDLKARDAAASIAVLVRSRTHLPTITASLIEAGHRVAAREIRLFAEIPVVNDLHAVARALLHRGDRIAWLALLRAPWCGASLAALSVIADGNDSIACRLGDDAVLARIEGVERPAVARVAQVMAQARSALAQWPFDRVLEQCWVALGAPAVYADAQSARDARAYLDIISRLEKTGEPLAPADIETQLGKRFSTPAAADPGAIAIMTIHGAKGLEFDHVLLPGCGRAPRGDPRNLLVWREDPGADPGEGLLVAPIPRASDGPRYDFLRRLDQSDAAAESVRLLYVALTRARRSVHLLAYAESNKQDKLLPRKGTFANLLWPVIEAAFAEPLTADSVTTPRGDVVERGIRRAAVADLPAPPCAAGLPGANDEDPAPVEFDWAGITAKHVGTVTHRLLQALAEHGWPDDTHAWRSRALAWSRGRLRALGVAQAELDAACERVAAALGNTLESERGRWLFATSHTGVRAEWCLAPTHTATARRAIIDRSFVDAAGVRWIVDFKTGSHHGSGLEAWLDSEVARYEPQLARYAAVVALDDTRAIRLGLYFPLVDAWREWPYSVSAQSA